jgi:hypothetical protein
MLKLTLACTLALACAHGVVEPINPLLGVPGFPDCESTKSVDELKVMTVEDAADYLKCFQRGSADAIKIGTIGDSITAGVHSTGGNHTYPGQLQIMLDQVSRLKRSN